MKMYLYTHTQSYTYIRKIYIAVPTFNTLLCNLSMELLPCHHKMLNGRRAKGVWEGVKARGRLNFPRGFGKQLTC